MAERKLVDKWLTLGAAIMDPALPKSELKLLWELLDHANVEQLAWPSMRTLAMLTGIERGNVVRHLAKVQAAGYIDLIKRGAWYGDSNHYSPTYKGADAMKDRRRQRAATGPTPESEGGAVTPDDTPVVTGEDTPPVIMGDDTLSSPVMQPVVTGEVRVSSPVTTKPPNEPAYKAGELVVEVEGSGPARDGAFGAALAAAPSPGKNAEAFSRFIAAYPRRRNVAKAEPAFDAAVASGVDVGLLVAQAAAYAARCESERTPDRFVAEPANWLRAQRWRDDFGARERSQGRPATATTERNPALDTETDPARLCRLRFEELQRVLKPILPGLKPHEKIFRVVAETHRNMLKGGDRLALCDTADEATQDAKKMLSAARRGLWVGSFKGSDDAQGRLWLWFGEKDGKYAKALIAEAHEMAAHERGEKAAA